MTKPLITLDMDGVLCDWMSSYLDYYNQQYNTNHRFQDCCHPDVAEGLGLPRENILISKKDKEIRQDILRWAPPIRYAYDNLEFLGEYFIINIITARQDEDEEITKEWLYKHMPFVPIVIHARSSANLWGKSHGMTKYEVAKELGAVCLVEDNHLEFDSWPADSPVDPIVHAQPWNVSTSLPRYEWGELYTYLVKTYSNKFVLK